MIKQLIVGIAPKNTELILSELKIIVYSTFMMITIKAFIKFYLNEHNIYSL